MIAETTTNRLNLNKLCGQRYDGCSTKENGMQVRIKSDYQLTVFFLCSAHSLNLVVNDLNAIVDVPNTIGTVKAIINFFREPRMKTPWTEHPIAIRNKVKL